VALSEIIGYTGAPPLSKEKKRRAESRACRSDTTGGGCNQVTRKGREKGTLSPRIEGLIAVPFVLMGGGGRKELFPPSWQAEERDKIDFLAVIPTSSTASGARRERERGGSAAVPDRTSKRDGLNSLFDGPPLHRHADRGRRKERRGKEKESATCRRREEGGIQ